MLMIMHAKNYPTETHASSHIATHDVSDLAAKKVE